MSCPACDQNRLQGKRFCEQCGAQLIFDAPPSQPEISRWADAYGTPGGTVILPPDEADAPVEPELPVIVDAPVEPEPPVIVDAPVEPEQPAQPEYVQWSGAYSAPAASAPYTPPAPQEQPAPQAYGQWQGGPAASAPYTPPVQPNPPAQPNPSAQPVYGQWQSGAYGAQPAAPYAPPAPDRADWGGGYPNPAAANPLAPPASPKKKKPVGAIIAIGVLLAALIGFGVLLATGVIRFGAHRGGYDITNEVLTDNDICRVTLQNVREKDDDLSFEIKLENTSNRSYYIGAVITAVNEYALRDYRLGGVSETLAAGESTVKTISLSKDILDDFDMEYADEVTINAYAAEDDESDEYPVDDYVKVYPTGLSERSFKRPDRVRMDGEDQVYDGDDVRVWIGDTEIDSDHDYAMTVYCENDGARVLVDLDDFEINGKSYDDYYVVAVGDKEASYQTIWLFEDMLEDIGLDPEDVESISFTLEVWDWDTLDTLESEYCVYYP